MNSNFNSSYIASNSLTYIPFLAHLAFRPCELLSSLFVRRPHVHISHVNLLLRNHWANCNQTFVEWSLVAPFQICVRWSRLPTKKSVKLKIEKKGDDIKKKSSPLKLLRQSQPNFAEMILGWSPSKMCPVIPTSNQDGRQAQNRKKGDEILIVHCCFSVSQNELKF